MYVNPYRRRRDNSPILIALLAFVITAAALVFLLWTRDPDVLLAAFKFVQTETPTPAETTPTPDLAITDTPTPRRTNTPRPTKTPLPSPTLKPTSTPMSLTEHFLFGRPVGPDATSDIPVWTYLYGTTMAGAEAVHHGEEFANPIGTPLIAVADGTVVTAGDDSNPICGPGNDQLCGERLDFYGNVVVIRLDQTYRNQPVFALYGHMSKIDVQVGQHISAGYKIGEVGASGVAEGPHVHFEVRVGVNDYAHTRNPILWMRPKPGHGALAGLAQDRNGNPLGGLTVNLYADNENQDYVEDVETYGRDEHPPVKSDDVLRENWAMADIPAGKYMLRVTIGGLNYIRHITVDDGRLSFVVFGGP